MLQIFKLLKKTWFVESINIIDLQQKTDWYYFKCQVLLKNNTILWIEETFDDDILDYSYHWQDSSDKLLMRWDNAPHHKEISTFPHHLHIGQQVEASYDPEFSYVLNEIGKIIKEQNNP